MSESWASVEEYVGKLTSYEVSNTGFVRSLRRGKYRDLTISYSFDGYRVVYLQKLIGGAYKVRTVRVGRLVGRYFVEGYIEELTIDHKDTDITNDHYSNLRWIPLGINVSLGHCRPERITEFEDKLNGNQKEV